MWYQTEGLSCAHANCGITPNTRVKTATGWAAVCWQHYDEFFQAIARDWCFTRGLDTREKQDAFVRQSVKRFAEEHVVGPREPGADENYVYTGN